MRKTYLLFAIMFSFLGLRRTPELMSPDTSEVKLVVTEYLKNLDTAWQLVFAPDVRVFFTERVG
jgi:hypothetical protein